MRRRDLLAGLAAMTGGGLALDMVDGDLDVPYLIGGMAIETAGELVSPGEEVPKEWIEVSSIPQDYQEYIDPTIEAGLEDLHELAYDRDLEWKRPEAYLDDGRGDCEDYAIAVASILERDEESANVVLGSLNGTGHVVAEDAQGSIYTVEKDGPVDELDGWEPALEFDSSTPVQGYTGGNEYKQ